MRAAGSKRLHPCGAGRAVSGPMASECVVGCDIGTTSTKAVLVSRDGRVLREASTEYGVLTPRPLWAEQWPDVWLEAAGKVIRELLADGRVAPQQVQALAISGLYGGSGVPCGPDMEPLRPCIIWMDRRATAEVEWVRRQVDLGRLFEITGNHVDSYYGYTKILWIQRHEPEVWARTRVLLPPNHYVIYRLTGQVNIDYSAAGNLGGVFDMGRRSWSLEMLAALGIDPNRLPQDLVSSAQPAGRLHREGASRTGLLEGTPVYSGGVDAAAATLSAGVLGGGEHVAMMGTSMCWGFVHAQKPRSPGLVSMPYVVRPLELVYSFGGAATAGALARWYRDELGGRERAAAEMLGVSAYRLLDLRAESVPPGSDGLIVLPYFMGERSPIWDPAARGTVVGLTLYHTAAHLYRAFLEGVAYALRHNIETAVQAGYPLQAEMRVVGGAARSPLWVQILADVTGRSVRVSEDGGEAAVGDAMLAALACGMVSERDLASWVRLREPVHPRPQASAVYDRYYPHYLGLYEDLRQRFAALAEVEQAQTGRGDPPEDASVWGRPGGAAGGPGAPAKTSSDGGGEP